MAYSEAQGKATTKWVKNNYDKIHFTAPKGFKERLKSAAENSGKTMRKFIIDALKKEMGEE